MVLEHTQNSSRDLNNSSEAREILMFKKLFLLKFTKELIKNSDPSAFIELEEIIRQQKQEKQEEEERESARIKRFVKDKGKKIENARLLTEPAKSSNLQIQKSKIIRTTLRIPSPKLPERFQYLQPIPTNKYIDLGVLNQFLQDPNVREIECNGSDESIIVTANGRKRTNLFLNTEEIEEVLQRFSRAAKIPLTEGVNKIVYGQLILSTIVSDAIGSRFIIKKIGYNTPMMNYG
jgi:hypothetical protein